MYTINMIAAAVLISILAVTGCSDIHPEITSGELADHVAYLASDELAGRFTGTPGILAAEEYIAGEFAEYGLEPLPGQDDFFLEFEIVHRSFEEKSFLSTSAGDQFVYGDDFKALSFSGSGTVTSEVVFAGYGITAPEYDYDDYADLDVMGKIVVIMRHEPDEQSESSVFEGKKHSDHALFRTKAEKAVSHGAVAMLLYTDPLHHDTDDMNPDRYRYALAGQEAREADPVSEGFIGLHITQSLAEHLLAGLDLEQAQRNIDAGKSPAEVDSGRDLSVTINLEASTKTHQARNVAAVKYGTGPVANEIVVIGAHHDHIGVFGEGGELYSPSVTKATGRTDIIFNGADDNASGVAAVLEIAERISVEQPDRSVVFITFSSEEVGLLGSYALREFELLDMSSVVFMLNLDMIGRNPEKPVEVLGDGFTEGLRQLVEEVNKDAQLILSLQGDTYVPFSDIAVFHEENIPYLMFFTGEHKDYHGTLDHAGKLDYERMVKVTSLSYDILERIAQSNEGSDALLHGTDP